MFSITPLSFDVHSPGNPREYPHKPYIANRVVGLHLRCWQYESSFKFSWWAPKDARLFETVPNGPTRSSKVIDFGTNRKRLCNFLLVTLVLSCPVSEILQVFWWKQHPTPIPPEFRGVSLRLDCRCWVSEERRPKLIIRIITFELTQHIRPRYHNVTDGQTDRQFTIAIPR